MASGGDGPGSMPGHHNLLLEREAPPLLTREGDFDPQDFSRQDESDDRHFYSQERLVTHIDDAAIEHVTAHYAQLIYQQRQVPGFFSMRKVRVLDLCSSWISHLPPGDPQLEVVGLGMNEGELSKNPQLSSYVVMNLNAAAADPAVPLRLPFDSGSFDLVVNSVSVDYLAHPLAVFREVHRVLRPGTGVLANTFSNRFFPTKVIRRWYRASESASGSLAATSPPRAASRRAALRCGWTWGRTT